MRQKAIQGAIQFGQSPKLCKAATGYFWSDIHKRSLTLNERQIKILNLLWEDFEEVLTTTKWAKITKCSQDTAHRDITDLIDKNLLKKGDKGGRRTHHLL